MKRPPIDCYVPPAPELEEKIIRTRQRILANEALPRSPNNQLLDLRTFVLIATRPSTRDNVFYSHAAQRAPIIGTKRVLVLLVDFSDGAATQTQGHYNDMLFSLGSYATGGMADFYREISYNKVTITGQVQGAGGPTAGWFRAPRPKSYYANNNFGFGDYPQNAQKLVEDVLDMAAPYVNFADYDNDGDGVVDALMVVAAGTGAEVTGNKNDIWSHKWEINPKTYNGVQIRAYNMQPEDGRVGVFSHELGHLLCGWPDLYDTDYTSAGTGRWDLMAGGSWNGGGDRPAHPTCWCKTKVGWVSPTTIFNAAQRHPAAVRGQRPGLQAADRRRRQQGILPAHQPPADRVRPGAAGRRPADRALRRQQEQQHRRDALPGRHRAGRRPPGPQQERQLRRRDRPLPDRRQQPAHDDQRAQQQGLRRRQLADRRDQHPALGRQHHGRHQRRRGDVDQLVL